MYWICIYIEKKHFYKIASRNSDISISLFSFINNTKENNSIKYEPSEVLQLKVIKF